MRLVSAEAGLWALGALLIATYFGARAYADVQRQQGVTAFTQWRSAQSASLRAASIRVPDQSQWSLGRIRAYAKDVALNRQEVPQAVLRIPRVKLEVPVYADTSERNLNRGAGLIAGTAGPEGLGNIGIAAHRDGFFRALEEVVAGDRIEIESRSGTQVYGVSELSIVSPDDMSPLRQTKQAVVTLVTCYPFYFIGNAPRRYIVRAVALSGEGQ